MLASRHVADAPVGELAVIRDLSCRGPGGRDPDFDSTTRARPAGPGRSSSSSTAAASCSAISTPTSRSAPRWRDGSTCRWSRSITGWRPSIPFPAGVEDCIAAARWTASSPAALGREVTGLVLSGDSAGGNFAIIVTRWRSRRAGRGPGARAMADLSGRGPGQGLSELAGFRRGLSAHPCRHGLVRRLLLRRSARLALRPLGEEPGRHAADPGRHREPRPDPRPGPGLCRRLRPGRRSDRLPARPRAISTASSTSGRRSLPRPRTSGLRRRAEAAAPRGRPRSRTDFGYRPAVGVMLLNPEGKVWVGQRLDSTLEAWQMPQGGLDPGEEPARGRLSRARGGDRHPRGLVEIVARRRRSSTYDLPDDLIGKVWKEQLARPAPGLVPARFLGRRRGRGPRHPRPRVPRLEMGRPRRASGDDRPVQEEALRGGGRGVRRLALQVPAALPCCSSLTLRSKVDDE